MVSGWKDRIELFEKKEKREGAEKEWDEDIEGCYEEALEIVHPRKAYDGQVSDLWLAYARMYEDRGDKQKAIGVFERAIKVWYKTVGELARVWCEYAEMYIREEEYEKAEQVLVRAITPVARVGGISGGKDADNEKGGDIDRIDYKDESISPQKRVFKSITVWQMYLDLEESSGNYEKIKAAYERVIQLRVATPQVIVNYANFLIDNQYYEEAFRTYEKGIAVFGYPVAFELWNIYLRRFVERYKGSKVERTRDLFEQALVNCPVQFSKPIYIMYGGYEEEYGLIGNALKVYERACEYLVQHQRQLMENGNNKNLLSDMYRFYISKTSLLKGDIYTRPIYEQAIESVVDEYELLRFVLEFADLETKFGEIDRARALFAYGASNTHIGKIDEQASQNESGNEKTSGLSLWDKWSKFEIDYGNESTYKEMLRIKRTVQIKYSTDVSYLMSFQKQQHSSNQDSSSENQIKFVN
ncbi:Pre-mRNA-splicing factor syf1 [Zancudomyces culisetae]|uniref:Pre-mRNA-splicing factor SYF1 n=1 Tax=Zancudomyces culisetae TaxID=1213189 RepID=A0A1R1PHP8_ZANCU|nr:Pre-mRNA-splicing factor syf1 [Zancudomyces culisetae]|eukprot:OMH80382.1 Pre-mRNA-splicing factor syf1 [Zancudomyces culisetae]